MRFSIKIFVFGWIGTRLADKKIKGTGKESASAIVADSPASVRRTKRQSATQSRLQGEIGGRPNQKYGIIWFLLKDNNTTMTSTAFIFFNSGSRLYCSTTIP